MYQYYGQPQLQNQAIFNTINNLKGRPVASLEEVKAATVDFDGSIFYFPDLANKKIYTKQINPDGTSSLNMYELKPIPVVKPSNNDNNYITREEFENAVGRLKELISGTQKSPQPPAASEDSTAFSF